VSPRQASSRRPAGPGSAPGRVRRSASRSAASSSLRPARRTGPRLAAQALEPDAGPGAGSRERSHRAGRACLRGGVEAQCRGHGLEASRQALPAGQPRRLVKTEFLNRQEFGIVGWTVPEGSRSSFGSLLLGYYRDDGQLIYAGRAGTGITESELRALLNRGATARLGQDFSRRSAAENHSVRQSARAFARALGSAGAGRRSYLPDLDGRRAAVVYEGLREDKAAREVRRVG